MYQCYDIPTNEVGIMFLGCY